MKHSLILLLVFFIASCSTSKNNVEILSKRKTLQITKDAHFTHLPFFTPNHALGAGLGGAVGQIAANAARSNENILDIRHIKDPAIKIKKDLTIALAKKYKFKTAKGKPKDSKDLLTSYDKGDLVLDINSFVNATYYPITMWYYKINYIAIATIMDRETKSVVFRTRCTYNKSSGNKNRKITLKTNKKLIPEFMKKATKHCSKYIISKAIKSKS